MLLAHGPLGSLVAKSCRARLIECLMSEDRAAAGRAFQAMLGMSKIHVAGIEAAFRGD